MSRRELYGFTEIEGGRRFEKRTPAGLLCVTRLLNAPEIAPCLEMMNRIWGFSERESIPLHEAVVSVITGGLFLRVDIENQPAGVVYVMPAHTPEWGYHHHSNFMGFVPELRSRGVGMEAKRVHAVIARGLGVGLVTWTFDPCQSLNANLNFRKLGAICRTYLPDLYGAMGGEFDSGLPTDRFLVEWRIDSSRVKARLKGEIPDASEVASGCDGFEMAVPDKEPPALAAGLLAEIPGGPDRGFEATRRELVRFREMISGLFRSGYAVTGMLPPGERGDSAYYLLEKGVEQ